MKDKIAIFILYMIIGAYAIINIWAVVSSIIFQFSNPELTYTQLMLHNLEYWWVAAIDLATYLYIISR